MYLLCWKLGSFSVLVSWNCDAYHNIYTLTMFIHNQSGIGLAWCGRRAHTIHLWIQIVRIAWPQIDAESALASSLINKHIGLNWRWRSSLEPSAVTLWGHVSDEDGMFWGFEVPCCCPIKVLTHWMSVAIVITLNLEKCLLECLAGACGFCNPLTQEHTHGYNHSAHKTQTDMHDTDQWRF